MNLIDVTYNDPIYGQLHVVVSNAVGGGGGSFSVNINDYFKGQIVKYNVGWISHVHTPMLSADDRDAIMDAILKWDK